MNCTATGKETQINGPFEVFTTSSLAYIVWIEEMDGTKIINPTDFEIHFFVKNRTPEYVCSREGSSDPINCEILTDGDIICMIPPDTFPTGQLCYYSVAIKDWAGFPPDGKYKQDDAFNTGIIYKDRSGL